MTTNGAQSCGGSGEQAKTPRAPAPGTGEGAQTALDAMLKKRKQQAEHSADAPDSPPPAE